jgi:type II secretory pathway pseudopilin PulG
VPGVVGKARYLGMSNRSRRAFSLHEVVLGLVLLMILAGMATFTIAGTTQSMKEQLVASSAKLFDETYRARLAYDLSLDATGEQDMTARIALAQATVSDAVSVITTPTQASFTQSGSTVCLTYATSPDTPGAITSGPC